MPVPALFTNRLSIPAIVAPMFLTSGPDLVVETCRSGLAGTFPALNQRNSEGFADWLIEIETRLAAYPNAAPFGVNLIVHRSNPRLAADLDIVVKHKVPFVITSLGAAKEVVDAVHGYGGLVLHDVINTKHARKAAQAGVDGIIAVCAGAGGHAGTLSPFALIPEIRSFYEGAIILSGVISTGRQIAAACMMGADLAYLGTRFLAVRESLAQEEYKRMIVGSDAADIVYTNAISGVSANFLRPSIAAAGLDPDHLSKQGTLNIHEETGDSKAWKTIWSAGQGVGSIQDVPAAAELCQRLLAEYRAAWAERPAL